MKRNVFRYAAGREEKSQAYRNLPLVDGSSTSTGIACSSDFIATGGVSAGRIIIMPVDHSKFKASSSPNAIAAHADTPGDLQFSPFHPNLLATGGDECVRLWTIPEGGLTESLSTPTVQVNAMEGGVYSIKFNPLIDGLLAVGCKAKLSIVDTSVGKSVYEFESSGFGKDLVSVDWDYYGNTVVSMGKDYSMYHIDPRKAGSTELKGVKCSGFRPQSCVFMGSTGHLIVSGVSSSRQPMLQVFDPRELTTPIASQDLELSPGFSMPLYDPDANLLFFTMRGSGMIKVFDCDRYKKKEEFTPLSNKIISGVTAGCCLLPKYACNVMESEVARVYVKTKKDVLPVAFIVPRKADGFHPELYPDTLSNRPSSVTVAEWKSGVDAKPAKLSIDEKLSNFKSSKKQETKVHVDTEAAGGGEEVKAFSKAQQKVASRLKRSAYTHLKGEEPGSTLKTYFGLELGRPANLNKNLDVNSKFFAFQAKTGGGSAVAILPRSAKLGRQVRIARVTGHTEQVSCFALSRVEPNLLATGAGDGVIRVTTLPDEPAGDTKKCDGTFECSGKVVCVRFHPRVPGVMLSCSMGFGESHMRLWDIAEGKEKALIDVHGDSEVMAANFNASGSLVATTAKDKKVRIIDVRKKAVVRQFSFEESTRDAQAFFLDSSDHLVLTVGFAKGSKAQVGVYDSRTGKSLAELELDDVSGTMLPHYDPDTRLLYIAGVGMPSVHFVLLSTAAPYVEALTRFKSASDFKGFVAVEKTECDVRGVQVCKAFHLSKDRITPITFTVPRKRKDYFQDDLFVPTASHEPMMTAAEWFADKDRSKEMVKYVSLQPSGMVALSKAPKEELTQRQKEYKKKLSEKDKPKAKGCLGHETDEQVRNHFRNLADIIDTTSNPWDAGAGSDQEDSDWSD